MSQYVDERIIKKCRKDHKCNCCGGTITKGSPYVDYIGKEDGKLYHYKQHTECRKVVGMLYDFTQPWDEIGSEEFVEGIDEFWHTFICGNCKKKEECEINNFDDCPCEQDTKDNYWKAKGIAYILKYARPVYTDNKWQLVSCMFDKEFIVVPEIKI